MSDFTPSPKLSRWLLVGAWAAFVDLWLSGSSLVFLFLEDADEEGFTLGDALDLVTILPQILVLLTFLALAREIGNLGLWRSSIAVFATGWIVSAFALTDTEELGPWEIGILVAVGVGALLVLLAVARRPAAFREPAGDVVTENAEPSGEDSQEEDSDSSGWGCLALLPVFIVVKLVVRGFRNLDLEWDLLVGIAVGIAMLAFLIWFGAVKIQLRREFGGWSTASAVADFGLVAAALALISHFVVLIAQLEEQEIEAMDFTDPRIFVPIALVSGYTIIWKALLLALFLAVRGRSRVDLLGEASGRFE